MDKKYIGKIISLPRATAAALEQFRTKLAADLGFDVSLSDAISNLCHERHQNVRKGRKEGLTMAIAAVANLKCAPKTSPDFIASCDTLTNQLQSLLKENE